MSVLIKNKSRYVLTVFSSMLICASVFASPLLSEAYSQCVEDDTGALDITVESGSTGETIIATVRIQNAPNTVTSLGFEVTYDAGVLAYAGYSDGECVSDFTFFACNELSPGLIRLGGLDVGENSVSEGASCYLVQLQFEVIQDPCKPGTCHGTLSLQNLVDDLSGWQASGGCFCCPPAGVCIEDESGALDITVESGSTGEEVIAKVRIQNAPDNATSLGFEVTYDTDFLQFSGYTGDNGGCAAGFTFFGCNENVQSPGVVTCGGMSAFSDCAVTEHENCDVVDLYFTAVDDPCKANTCPAKLGLQNLVDDIAGWPVSHGCFCCRVLIELSSFAAFPKSKKVILKWTTESEVGNAGFNLYRSEEDGGYYEKINDSLILAEGSPTEGETYEFVDDDVRNRKAYYYKLEDIDLNEKSTMHGPMKAIPRLIYGLGK